MPKQATGGGFAATQDYGALRTDAPHFLSVSPVPSGLCSVCAWQAENPPLHRAGRFFLHKLGLKVPSYESPRAECALTLAQCQRALEQWVAAGGPPSGLPVNPQDLVTHLSDAHFFVSAPPHQYLPAEQRRHLLDTNHWLLLCPEGGVILIGTATDPPRCTLESSCAARHHSLPRD